jgi:polyisoprenoid-binding protein YceI
MTYLTLFFLIQLSFAQESYTLVKSKSTLQIHGTSTLHDWVSNVEDFKVKLGLANNAIESFTIEAKVMSIKSGKESMDENTWEALKYEKYKTISFNLTDVEASNENDESTQVKATGWLEIAGVSQRVTIDGELIKSNSNVSLKGEKSLKMTDFEVDPPTMFLGTVRTGDKVTIKFNLNFKLKDET